MQKNVSQAPYQNRYPRTQQDNPGGLFIKWMKIDVFIATLFPFTASQRDDAVQRFIVYAK